MQISTTNEWNKKNYLASTLIASLGLIKAPHNGEFLAYLLVYVKFSTSE